MPVPRAPERFEDIEWDRDSLERNELGVFAELCLRLVLYDFIDIGLRATGGWCQ